jgi:integrase
LAAPALLMSMLQEHIEAKGLGASDEDALLFTSPVGGFLRYSNWVRRCWYPAAVAAGVGRMVKDVSDGRERYDGLGFHDLRRANATGLVAEGVDVKTAQTMLGHSEARLTLDVYAQAVAKLGEAAAEAMGARFLPPGPRDGRAMASDPDGEPG